MKPALTAYDTALAFIIRHAAEHLDAEALVSRTADHVAAAHDISRATAFEVSSQAWAEYDGCNAEDWIDIARSTTRCVVVHLEGIGTAALTIRYLRETMDRLKQSGITPPVHGQ